MFVSDVLEQEWQQQHLDAPMKSDLEADGEEHGEYQLGHLHAGNAPQRNFCDSAKALIWLYWQHWAGLQFQGRR